MSLILVVWVIVYAVNHRGITSMKWAIYLTFPMTVALLIVICLIGITRGNGVSAGVLEYIMGKPDQTTTVWDELRKTAIWIDAANQVHFSLGVSMWTIYGSYNKLEKPIIGDALRIAIFDTCYAFVAGIGVFSMIGYIRESNFSLSEENGLELSFVYLPSTIATSMSSPRFWCGFIFLCMFLTALDT